MFLYVQLKQKKKITFDPQPTLLLTDHSCVHYKQQTASHTLNI